MPELVTVSHIERIESLKTYINDLFSRGKLAEITQAVGMHSILVDPERMREDQGQLYRLVLNLLKKQAGSVLLQQYSSWLAAFPGLLARIIEDGRIVTDDAARTVLASRHAAFGAFTSVDEFFFWALQDRRLPLDQIARYILTTVEMHRH